MSGRVWGGTAFIKGGWFMIEWQEAKGVQKYGERAQRKMEDIG